MLQIRIVCVYNKEQNNIPMKTIAKTAFILLTLSVSLSLQSCLSGIIKISNNNFEWPSDKVSFVQEYPAQSNFNLAVTTQGGAINVEGYDGQKAIVNFIVYKSGRVLNMTLDELKKIAEVEIKSNEGMLSINIKRIRPHNLNVGFRIKVPVNTKCKLLTSGGSILLKSLTGNQDFITSGGSFILEKLKGNLTGRTSGGSICMSDIQGQMDLLTSGGGIDGKNLTGNLLAKSSGGGISLDGMHGFADVSTSGGGIDLANMSGGISASTGGGSIEADILKLTSRLSLTTSGGSIECTMPGNLGMNLNLSGDRVNINLVNFTGNSTKNIVAGQMNGGGIPVVMSTSGGSVSVNFR